MSRNIFNFFKRTQSITVTQQYRNISFAKQYINIKNKKLRYVVLGSVCITSYIYFKRRNPVILFKSNTSLPYYSLTEVQKHSQVQNRIWITYKEGVYDITDFVDKHPGGDKILMAAGGAAEPFWAIYGVHKKPEILSMLEEYRIGNLQLEDIVVAGDDNDPYSKEPTRHPALRPSAVKPYNAEPPPSILVDSFVTPNDLFYVRNHLPVPEIDPQTYTLEISGCGKNEVTLTLQDLKTKFKKHTITAAIQCAGNRRSEMTKVKAVKGLDWGHAAIGNATWSGARLIDVLKYYGLKNNHNLEHVQFEGLDTDPAGFPYGASIPIEKALDEHGDVLLAYEMNGQPIPRDHGYPIRVIVPGVVGARNVKWLSRIILSREESSSHWQQNDYKGFSPSTDWDTVNFKTAPAIQELPVISAICDPEQGQSVRVVEDSIKVRGYAWSGGGRKIVRVDVTADGGKTWHVAELEQGGEKHPYHWGWSLWSINVPVDSKTNKVEIWAKATDSSYNTQPEAFENIWNLRGVLSNAYHRVLVYLKHDK